MAITPYQRALDLLAARPYSAKELHRKLLQHGAESQEAEGVIERLREAGIVDDAKYAVTYARSKLLGIGASRRRIQQELQRKGVARNTIAKAVDQVVIDEEVDIEAVIERVARKKLALMGDLEPLLLRRRLHAFLARRGYDLDEIQGVVQTLLSER